MAQQPQTGIRGHIAANFWVIIVDAVGALFLLSLLLTAAGAPALKEWMFVLLTAVPVMAMITIIWPQPKARPVASATPIRQPVERRIVISPRPCDQRAGRAA